MGLNQMAWHQYRLFFFLPVQFDIRFLSQSIFSNGLECLLNVDGFLGRCFEIRTVSSGLAESHGTLLRNLSWLGYQYKAGGNPQDLRIAALTVLLLSSRSILLPSTTKGKLSGSRGDAWTRNSSCQLFSESKLLVLLTSYTSTQQSAPR